MQATHNYSTSSVWLDTSSMPSFAPLEGDTGADVCVIGAVYIITGDSGNGMTHCTAGAILVADQILGRANRWSALYSPAREPFHGAPGPHAAPGTQWWRG